MLKVPVSSSLPVIIPRMHSRDHPSNYDPILWEGQYLLYRYLGRVSEEALVERYRCLHLNLRTFAVQERHKYPIQLIDGAWYWYKKEHETRLEFLLRGIPLPQLDPLPPSPIDGLPTILKDRDAPEALFRYSSPTALAELRRRGKLSIAPARTYQSIERTDPRHDNEQTKQFFYPGAYTTISTKDGRRIPISGDVKQTVTGPDYYVLCTSRVFDPHLHDAFRSVGCAKIADADAFAARLQQATAHALGTWYFHHNPVRYFDPYRRERHESVDNGMSKDFRFAYQQEYRFIWIALHDQTLQALSYREFELGPLDDLIELLSR